MQRILSGVAEGRVAKVMRQCHRLGQFDVEAKRAGDGARDLRHLDRMGQTGAVIVAFVLHEDLGLVLQPAKGRGMDDTVPIALKGERKVDMLSG